MLTILLCIVKKFFHHDFWTATKLSFSDPTRSQKVTPVHIGCVIIQMECCAIHFKTFWENLARPMSSIIDWNSNRQVSSTHKIGSTQYILDKTFYILLFEYMKFSIFLNFKCYIKFILFSFNFFQSFENIKKKKGHCLLMFLYNFTRWI